MTDIELPEPVRRVLGAARCDVRAGDDQLEIAEGEREIRYLLRSANGLFQLIRFDRGDPAQLEISAERLDDVFRYLMVELAPVARAYHRLVPSIFPTFADEDGNGFSRQEIPEGVLVERDGTVRAAFRPEDPFGVSRSRDFTWYADLELDRIAALVLTTSVGAEPASS